MFALRTRKGPRSANTARRTARTSGVFRQPERRARCRWRSRRFHKCNLNCLYGALHRKKTRITHIPLQLEILTTYMPGSSPTASKIDEAESGQSVTDVPVEVPALTGGSTLTGCAKLAVVLSRQTWVVGSRASIFGGQDFLLCAR